MLNLNNYCVDMKSIPWNETKKEKRREEMRWRTRMKSCQMRSIVEHEILFERCSHIKWNHWFEIYKYFFWRKSRLGFRWECERD